MRVPRGSAYTEPRSVGDLEPDRRDARHDLGPQLDRRFLARARPLHDGLEGLVVVGIGTESVDRFCWKGDQAAATKDVDGVPNVRRVRHGRDYRSRRFEGQWGLEERIEV